MKKNFLTAILMTVVTTALLGVLFPLMITGIAQLLFPRQANGQLIRRDGVIIGSRLIGQQFSSPGYFHSRPSGAGDGYDSGNSGGTNLGPTNQKLVARVHSEALRLRQENLRNDTVIPIDLLTTSASGLDPHISPEGAEFQMARVALARGLSLDRVRDIVRRHLEQRQAGFLGETRINVLELNLELDEVAPLPH